ncbi:glycerophosphodiester phosphodiesterase [Alteribacillus iranensis]|uniref:Glycerophosphoryl diester phosphodiesterase n=1 Tax=Alteribacillus iranensis TaxID=930128 RepID=A0A1I2EQQ6_9BACI|nr:glycerophosphodiester phosphodiesterase [Alteribacillus iranensis]SFE94967.1 glycerophosphoryl diester phosphodiesterase [Alteribacillus iranensis]
MNNSIEVIAHRGSTTPTIRENTILAFRKAIEWKADMIETDVRRMKDGTLVCAHNPDWKGKRLSDMTYEEWKRLTLTEEGWQPARLKETFELCEGRIPLNLEIKEKDIESEVFQAIPESYPVQDLLFSSFEDQVIKKIKSINSNVKTSLIVGKSMLGKAKIKGKTYWRDYYPETRLRETDADAICPYYKLLDRNFVSRLRGNGYRMYVWTVNKEEKLREVKNYEIDGIFTDDVPLAFRIF